MVQEAILSYYGAFIAKPFNVNQLFTLDEEHSIPHEIAPSLRHVIVR